MEVTRDALWISAAALVVAALALSLVGPRQRRQRGWRCWVAALWLAAAAALLAALAGPAAAAAVTALLLLWPLLTLRGLRRFHGRAGGPDHLRLDLGVAVAALAAGLAGPLAGPDSLAALLLPGVGAAALHLYVGGVLCAMTPERGGAATRLLGATIALAGVLPPLLAGPGLAAPPVSALQVLAAAPAALVMAFTTLLMVVRRSEHELRESRRRLRVLADLDALTRVPNRRRFDELARRAMRAAGRSGTALAIFDIDHFKLVNDRHGHAAGDRALCLVAACMQSQLRPQDVAGRLGGDEFVLLLHDAEAHSAIGVAARIVEHVQAQAVTHRLPLLSLSFGVAEWREGETLAEALQRADRALYEAKRLGRSCAVAAHGVHEPLQFSTSQRLGLSAG